LQKDNGPCAGTGEQDCRGACEQTESPARYNKRVEKAIASLLAQPSFAILDKGLGADDRSCILVVDGNFYGMGYIEADFQANDLETLKDQLTQYRENSFIRNIVLGYAARYPDKVTWLKNPVEIK
jgi:DNA polymerase-3 subunit epsilon